jgi:hypothetical protein
MSAVFIAETGVSANTVTTAPHIPTNNPVSQARASSGGSPQSFMSGAKNGESSWMTSSSTRTCVTSVTGTMMRTNSQ